MSTYRDTGIVLRTQKLGEADRIITLLTRRHGRIRAVAKGVRRTSSRIGARLEPFAHVDVQCYSGRSLDIAQQIETIDAFGGKLSRDYARWTAGQAMLEAAERFTENEHDPALAQYQLLLGGLRALAETERDPVMVLDAFLVRSLSIAGYAPSFSDCAGCGAIGPHRFFTIPGGGASCADCRPPACAAPGADTLVLLGALLSGDWDTRRGVRRPRSRREASGLVAAYLQWHLERGLRSLRHVERDTADAPHRMSKRQYAAPPPHPSGARPPKLPAELIPRHVAIVMDGNGRWAKSRGLARTKGHEAGEAALLDVICGAIEIGVQCVSAYAFSTENWKRTPDEVRFLMGFNRDVIHRRRDELDAMGVRVRWAGRRPKLWRSVISELEDAEAARPCTTTRSPCSSA